MLLFGFAHPAFADDTSPVSTFSSRTQHPLYLQFLSMLPTLPDELPRGKQRISIQTVHTNLYEAETNVNAASVDFDMEIWRSSVLLDYGLGEGLELRVEIPFLHFSGGFLDEFVQDYHALFGFPNSGREDVDNGRFAYTVSQNGAVIYNVSQSNFQMGDWTLGLKIPVYQTASGYSFALTPLFKLPVGKADNGTGSGHVDAGISFFAHEDWGWFSMSQELAAIAVGGHDALDPLLRSHLIQGSQRFAFAILDTLALIIDLHTSSPLFKAADNNTLDGIPLDLVIGFSGTAFPKKTGHLFWQLAFSEDPLGSGASVDFSTYMRIGYLF